MNWSNIELAVAIVCACLPTYGPFLKRSPIIESYLKSWYTQFLSRTAPRSHDSRSSKGGVRLTAPVTITLMTRGKIECILLRLVVVLQGEARMGKEGIPQPTVQTKTQLEVV